MHAVQRSRRNTDERNDGRTDRQTEVMFNAHSITAAVTQKRAFYVEVQTNVTSAYDSYFLDMFFIFRFLYFLIPTCPVHGESSTVLSVPLVRKLTKQGRQCHKTLFCVRKDDDFYTINV